MEKERFCMLVHLDGSHEVREGVLCEGLEVDLSKNDAFLLLRGRGFRVEGAPRWCCQPSQPTTRAEQPRPLITGGARRAGGERVQFLDVGLSPDDPGGARVGVGRGLVDTQIALRPQVPKGLVDT